MLTQESYEMLPESDKETLNEIVEKAHELSPAQLDEIAGGLSTAAKTAIGITTSVLGAGVLVLGAMKFGLFNRKEGYHPIGGDRSDDIVIPDHDVNDNSNEKERQKKTDINTFFRP